MSRLWLEVRAVFWEVMCYNSNSGHFRVERLQHIPVALHPKDMGDRKLWAILLLWIRAFLGLSEKKWRSTNCEGGDDEGNGTDNDNKDGDEEDEEEEEGTDHGEDGNDDEDKAEKEEEEDTKRGKTTAKDPANSQIVAKAAANFATTSKPGRPSVTAVLNGKGLARKTSKKGWSKVRKAVRKDTAFFMHEMEEKIHNDFMKMHLANEKNSRKKDLVDPTEDTGKLSSWARASTYCNDNRTHKGIIWTRISLRPFNVFWKEHISNKFESFMAGL